MKIESDMNNVNNISFKMDIAGVGGNTAKTGVEKNSLFEQFYTAALDVVDETNLYSQQAEQMQRDFALGKTDNVLAVTMAQEKATSTLNFTVQVTNKVIEAYREIMRIQL